MWRDHTGDSPLLKSGAEFTAVNCIYVTFITTVFLRYKILYNKSEAQKTRNQKKKMQLMNKSGHYLKY